jgi:hypothetical protein
MQFVSVTRLRVRSYFYMPQFMVWALRTARQARHTEGFVGGAVMRESGNVFWTLTMWREDAAMKAYRTAGAHRSAMPKLLEWCDEASVSHWTQESPELPQWDEAHRRLLNDGKPSKVNRPTPAHLAHEIPAPRPGRIEAPLKPMRQSR